MRVAIVAETFLPAVNGVVNSVVEVSDHLVSQGHEAVVIAAGGAPSSFRTRSGYRVGVVSVPRMRVPAYPELVIARPGGDLRAILGDIRPDVVHLASPLVLGWSAMTAAVELDLPTVAVYQTDVSGFLPHYRLKALTPALWLGLRRLHNRADLTLAPSTAALRQLRAHGIGPLAIWGRGVDSDRFHPRHRSESRHAELGGVGTLLVGYIGRLAPEKRVELLEPISRLPGVRLVIIGDGPNRDSLQRLMPQAKLLGLQTGSELARLMASLDLLVNPGGHETFCQVVQEALASGVPVLAAAAGGPLDLIRHGQTGWFCPGDSPAALASVVEDLRDDRAELAAVARRTRKSVVDRSWSRLGDELIGHYTAVLTARAASATHGGMQRWTNPPGQRAS